MIEWLSFPRPPSALIENVCNLPIAVTIDKAIDLRDDLGFELADFRNYANCTNMLSQRSSAEYYRCSSICWSELFDHLPNIILRFPSTPPLAQVGEVI